MEFLIEQSTIGYDKVIQFRNRACCCSRSVHILACGWGNTICNRSVCISSIWCSTSLSAKGYVCRNRIKSCLVLSTTWVLKVLKRSCICVSHISCEVVHFRNIISEFRNFCDHIVDFLVSCHLLRCHLGIHNRFQDSCCSIRINLGTALGHLS